MVISITERKMQTTNKNFGNRQNEDINRLWFISSKYPTASENNEDL